MQPGAISSHPEVALAIFQDAGYFSGSSARSRPVVKICGPLAGLDFFDATGGSNPHPAIRSGMKSLHRVNKRTVIVGNRLEPACKPGQSMFGADPDLVTH